MSHLQVAARRAIVLVCIALLAACSAQSQPAPSSSEASSSSAPTQDLVAEWRAWRPSSVTITPRQFTDEEAAKLRHDWLEANRPEAASGRPIPDLVAWSTTDNEPIAQCLRDAGFKATQGTPDGGIGIDEVTEAQSAAADIAQWECQAKYTPTPAHLQQGGHQQWEVLYEYYTGFYLDCLKRQGFDLPRSDIPSKDVWVAEIESGNSKDHWDPTDSTSWPAALKQKYNRLHSDELGVSPLDQICPRMPPQAALWGE